MPIQKMNFDGDIFAAIQVGYFDNVDVRMWANALQNHAKKSAKPVYSLLELVEVDRICSSVPKLVTKVLTSGNVAAIIIIADPNLISQNDRVFDKLAKSPDMRIVPDRTTANAILRQLRTGSTRSGFNSPYATAFNYTVSFAMG